VPPLDSILREPAYFRKHSKPGERTRVVGPSQGLVYSPGMTKRGIVAIAVVVVVAVVLILVFTLNRSSPEAASAPVYTIAIDAGHGGRDPGATADDVYEKDINLDVTTRVVELAKAKAGLDPVQIRSLDIFISLEDRIVQAEEAGAVLYVTIHVNSYTGPDPSGVETIVDDTRTADDDSWVLAELIQNAIVEATGARDRGTRMQESYLQRTEMPAVSVEMGYLTNPDERAKLVDPAYQETIAEAILAGIEQFVEWKYPPAAPTAQP